MTILSDIADDVIEAYGHEQAAEILEYMNRDGYLDHLAALEQHVEAQELVAMLNADPEGMFAALTDELYGEGAVDAVNLALHDDAPLNDDAYGEELWERWQEGQEPSEDPYERQSYMSYRGAMDMLREHFTDERGDADDPEPDGEQALEMIEENLSQYGVPLNPDVFARYVEAYDGDLAAAMSNYARTVTEAHNAEGEPAYPEEVLATFENENEARTWFEDASEWVNETRATRREQEENQVADSIGDKNPARNWLDAATQDVHAAMKVGKSEADERAEFAPKSTGDPVEGGYHAEDKTLKRLPSDFDEGLDFLEGK